MENGVSGQRNLKLTERVYETFSVSSAVEVILTIRCELGIKIFENQANYVLMFLTYGTTKQSNSEWNIFTAYQIIQKIGYVLNFYGESVAIVISVMRIHIYDKMSNK